MVNIGFSRHLAWTHTVDTSSHFTLYRLALDPKDPRRYLVDGRSLPLEEKSVAIEVQMCIRDRGNQRLMGLLLEQRQLLALAGDQAALLGDLQGGGRARGMAGLHQAQDVLGVVQVEPGDALLFAQRQYLQVRCV